VDVQSFLGLRQSWRYAESEAQRCADQAWRREPRATRGRDPNTRRFEPPRGRGPKKIPQGNLRGKPGDEGCAIAA
jgi:hypothetical protein